MISIELKNLPSIVKLMASTQKAKEIGVGGGERSYMNQNVLKSFSNPEMLN